VSGPAGVTALVLAETVSGGLVLLFLTPLWSEVRRGFFTLTGSVLLVLSFATWGAAAAGSVPGSEAGAWSVRLSAALAFVNLGWVGLMFAKRHAAARVGGIVSVDGLLLGHWYLTDRGLTRTPINRTTNLLFVGVGLEATALLIGGFGPTEASSEFNPLLTSAGLASWIALGMVAATGLIAVMIRATLKGSRSSAVQSATGFFYLAVITALTAEFAAKVTFLP